MLLTVLTLSEGCAAGKKNGIVYDHRDYVEVPKGTVIKGVPFYITGDDKHPELRDFTTPDDGAWYSGTGQEIALAVKKGAK